MSDLETVILTELSNKHGSDKGTVHPVAGHYANNYMPLYAEYFAKHGFKRDAPLRILEIGINQGASLEMWAEYFPNATVYGLDVLIPDHVAKRLAPIANIKTALADQGNTEELFQALHKEFHICPPWFDFPGQETEREFDIIIDDGSHDQAHQQISWGYLWSWLKPGGLYVIEDIITGEGWWDGNTYNRHRIIATRALIQMLQQTLQFKSPVMEPVEIKNIIDQHSYCHYREADVVIYERHHPQLAFIGKR